MRKPVASPKPAGEGGLSAAAHDAGEGKGPDVAELAGRIKTLKAANTIEAAPQRGRQKQAAAEEPITARIRRRQEASIEADEAIHPDDTMVLQPANDNHHAANDNGPAPSFAERIARERQRLDREPSLT